jgi:hypothetical protein
MEKSNWRKVDLAERQRALSICGARLGDGIDGVMRRTDRGIDDGAGEVAD